MFIIVAGFLANCYCACMIRQIRKQGKEQGLLAVQIIIEKKQMLQEAQRSRGVVVNVKTSVTGAKRRLRLG